MIKIEFQINEPALDEDLKNSPATADAAAIEETYFVMPIRFSVHGTELLVRGHATTRFIFQGSPDKQLEAISSPNPGSYWMPLPIIGFTVNIWSVLNRSRSQPTSTLDLSGGVRLK